MSSFNDTQRSSMGSHDRMVRYREIYENLSTTINENGYNENMSNLMNSTIQEVQSLHDQGGMEDRMRRPGELYLDSRVLKAASDIAVRATESVSGNVNIYDKMELAQHIRENPNFWSFMLPRTVPTVAFLYGTFAPTPLELRPRAPRRAVQRQQAQALKAPDKVDKLQKVDEGSDMMSRVNRFIKKTYKQTGQPLSYFHTVLDPGSFCATIENIYYVSFLVKDTLVSITLDDEFGLPFITPVASTGEIRDIAEENQFIVSLDEQRWQDLINAFGITRPMMVLKRS